MKIRWRLTWYGIGFTALSLVVFIVVINFLVIGSAQKDQDALLGRIADEAAAALAEVDTVDLTRSVPPAIPDATVSDQAFFTVYDDIGSTSDLSRRLPLVDQDDEVGALTDSFNAMLDGIEGARRDRDLIIDAQKRFVADASHELRSPLTSIRANAGFLLDRPDASRRDRVDATSDISQEADRMSVLIDDLLTLARADIRKDDRSDFAPVDLVAIARSIERRARNLHVDLTLEAPDSLLVSGYASDLAEVLWVLVDNANRHGAESASVYVRSSGTEATVEIVDDGPGIPSGETERIFDRFHRSDPARSGPGYGLGLSIARSIVECHGGRIATRDTSGSGATFTVVPSLPST